MQSETKRSLVAKSGNTRSGEFPDIVADHYSDPFNTAVPTGAEPGTHDPGGRDRYNRISLSWENSSFPHRLMTTTKI